MSKLSFSNALFATSALDIASWPSFKTAHGDVMPEIAFVGRSNVGKSSLLNHLLRRKNLARVSSRPGKTQTLNFFIVDDLLSLVDLPGYGYAQVSKEIQQNWSESLDLYLKKRERLSLILFLLDIRRLPTKEDIAFIEWSRYHHKPILVVFTKCDKVSQKEKKQQTEQYLDLLSNPPHCHYSIKDPKARIDLIHQINRMLTASVNS
jgi:GTP-binding protein